MSPPLMTNRCESLQLTQTIESSSFSKTAKQEIIKNLGKKMFLQKQNKPRAAASLYRVSANSALVPRDATVSMGTLASSDKLMQANSKPAHEKKNNKKKNNSWPNCTT